MNSIEKAVEIVTQLNELVYENAESGNDVSHFVYFVANEDVLAIEVDEYVVWDSNSGYDGDLNLEDIRRRILEYSYSLQKAFFVPRNQRILQGLCPS